MASAMQSAQDTFWEFARNAELERRRIVPGYTAILVKAFLPSQDSSDHGEFHFIDDIVISKTHVTGTLNGASRACGLEMGDQVCVPVSNVCDWLILPGIGNQGRGIGGFTVDVLRQSIPPEQREEYESHPPVSWYRHRQDVTALDELLEVPKCVECGNRDLMDFSYRDGKCGCCTNGLERTNCSKCDFPIVRPAGHPTVCFSCESQDQTTDTPSPLREGQATAEMSTQAKIYCGCVMLVLALVGVMLAMMIFDPAGGQARGRTTVLGIFLPAWGVLAGTLTHNIVRRKLVVPSTILQIIALFLTCVGFPIGVFGIVALINQRTTNRGFR
jgi:uncharacterized protein YegJ (DUF2314 family)